MESLPDEIWIMIGILEPQLLNTCRRAGVYSIVVRDELLPLWGITIVQHAPTGTISIGAPIKSPATRYGYGTYWFRDGDCHRTGGPAVVTADHQIWFHHNQIHRRDGPAYIGEYTYWYKYGRIHRKGGPAVITSDGAQFWCRHGRRHRDDGPAVLYMNGDTVWYSSGEIHRVGGPAAETATGRVWLRRDVLSRDDGPAVEMADGRTWWSGPMSPAPFVDVNYHGVRIIWPKN